MTPEELYEQFHAELLRFAVSMTESRAEAEDAVQEAFYRAVLHAETLSGLDRSRARAWLYRTVKNVRIDRLRRRHGEQLTDAPPEGAQRFDALGEAEWRMVLDALPPPDGELLWKNAVEGVPSDALGRAYGMPAGTVRYRLYLARKQLRTILGGKQDV